MIELFFGGILAYCGLFAGILLCKLSQDEIVAGQKHFSFIYAISVFMYLGSIIYSKATIFAHIIVIICAIVFYFRKRYYQMLFATFPFALLHVDNPLLISIFFFIVGLLVTTQEMNIFVQKKKLKIRKEVFMHLIAKTFYFFPAAIILLA